MFCLLTNKELELDTRALNVALDTLTPDSRLCSFSSTKSAVKITTIFKFLVDLKSKQDILNVKSNITRHKRQENQLRIIVHAVQEFAYK